MKTLLPLIVLCLVIVFFTACGSDSPPNSPSVESISKAPKDTIVYYVSQVEDLSIRKAPDVKSEILGKIKYDAKVKFENETTDFKDKITLRGIVKYEPWVRVNYDGIIGWAFMGGLKNEDDIYQPKDGGGFIRRFDYINFNELEEVVGMELDGKEEVYFKGFVEYKLSESGNYIKDGEMSFVSSSNVKISDSYSAELRIKLLGHYSDGLKDGLFEFNFNGYESNSVFTINFKGGKCVWGSVIASGEGEDYSLRENNLQECSFPELGRLMKEKY